MRVGNLVAVARVFPSRMPPAIVRDFTANSKYFVWNIGRVSGYFGWSPRWIGLAGYE